MTTRPKLAVLKFASCDGCQLSLLDLEDELLTLAGAIEIADFPEASSARTEGPFDVTLVEGSVSVPDDLERVRQIRSETRFLVTIGACATSGGIQALRNAADHDSFVRTVYPHPDYIASLATSTPIADHVPVDFELRGCPIDKHQLLEVLSAFLAGRRPHIPRTSVCTECKRRGIVCLPVSRGIPCLGPVTQAGCGALCPACDRGCYGCFGPMETPNTAAMVEHFRVTGRDERTIARAFSTFNNNAPAFRQVASDDTGGASS